MELIFKASTTVVAALAKVSGISPPLNAVPFSRFNIFLFPVFGLVAVYIAVNRLPAQFSIAIGNENFFRCRGVNR
jgi:hypothetical protein